MLEQSLKYAEIDEFFQTKIDLQLLYETTQLCPRLATFDCDLFF